MSALFDSDTRSIDSKPLARGVRVLLIGLIAVSVMAPPAAAADGPPGSAVCNSDTGLADMIKGLQGVMMGLGGLGAVAAYQANTVMGMLSLGEQRRKKVEQHRRKVMMGGLKLLIAPYLAYVLFTAMGLGLADCLMWTP